MARPCLGRVSAGRVARRKIEYMPGTPCRPKLRANLIRPVRWKHGLSLVALTARFGAIRDRLLPRAALIGAATVRERFSGLAVTNAPALPVRQRAVGTAIDIGAARLVDGTHQLQLLHIGRDT